MPVRTCIDCGRKDELVASVRSLRCKSCASKRNVDPNKWYRMSTGYLAKRFEGRHILQHRFVLEQHLGRTLKASEIVHHRNGNIRDNRIENLTIVVDQTEHMREHFSHRLKDGKLQCCRCGAFKDFSEFPKRNNRPLGVQGYCRRCGR